MRSFFLAILVACNYGLCTAQPAIDSDPSKLKLAIPDTTLIGPAPITQRDLAESDSLIRLNMVIVQASNDEANTEDDSKLMQSVEHYAQEIKDAFESQPKNQPHKSDVEESIRNDRSYASDVATVKTYKKFKHKLKLLSMPSIATRSGNPASVSIGQETALPYMEQIDAETFKLRHTPPGVLGIDISLTPGVGYSIKDFRSVEKHVLQSSVKLSVSAIDGREKVEEFDLPIGKPIVTRRTIETSLTLEEGEPGIIELPVAKGKHVFMIVFVHLPKQNANLLPSER